MQTIAAHMAALRPAERLPCTVGESIHAARPVFLCEEHVAAQVLVAEVDGRGALEGITILVRIAGDGGDPRQAEVEHRHVVAQLFDPGQDEAAQAAIDVQANLVLQRQVGELADRVDHTVGIGAGRPSQATVLGVI